ncbi:hypothetical protein ABC345_20770 [Shouchella sp. 1P09AA]|uniref:hypothetical protein n=1 Tax=unclassified Shouchella TaxID=2893065 RepID=UPI0039A1159C
MFVKNPYLDILICFVGTFFTTYVLHLLLAFADHSFHENWSLHLAQAIGLTTGLAL